MAPSQVPPNRDAPWGERTCPATTPYNLAPGRQVCVAMRSEMETAMVWRIRIITEDEK